MKKVFVKRCTLEAETMMQKFKQRHGRLRLEKKDE